MHVARRLLTRLEELCLVALFAVLVVACTAQILFRFLLNYPLDWTEELARLVFIALVYIGASAAIRLDRHARVEAVDALLGPSARRMVLVLGDLLWLAFTLTIAWYGLQDTLEKLEFDERSPAMQWPMWITVAFIPATFLLMALRILERVVNRFRPPPPDGETPASPVAVAS